VDQRLGYFENRLLHLNFSLSHCSFDNPRIVGIASELAHKIISHVSPASNYRPNVFCALVAEIHAPFCIVINCNCARLGDLCICERHTFVGFDFSLNTSDRRQEGRHHTDWLVVIPDIHVSHVSAMNASQRLASTPLVRIEGVLTRGWKSFAAFPHSSNQVYPILHTVFDNGPAHEPIVNCKDVARPIEFTEHDGFDGILRQALSNWTLFILTLVRMYPEAVPGSSAAKHEVFETPFVGLIFIIIFRPASPFFWRRRLVNADLTTRVVCYWPRSVCLHLPKRVLFFLPQLRPCLCRPNGNRQRYLRNGEMT